jgi:2-oxoglutarate ferredoxin oxidoreductase subunit alpha
MRYNIIIGGKAGQGPNLVTEIVAEGLLSRGYYVFYSRDYESLIRGGHNFNVLSFSDEPIFSNTLDLNILVCLDENTEEVHKKNLVKGAIVLNGQHSNMFFTGQVYKILGIEIEILEKHLKKLKNFVENMKEAIKGYNFEKRTFNLPKINPKAHSGLRFMNGSQAIAYGAVKSGLDFYYAYPMTPATPVMMELGQMQLEKENQHKVIELESETAVINAAIGSSIVGKKSMVGTSGGGFDLMTESLSLAGMAEIPLVIYLGQRPGPSTGVATYTGQGDLNLALHAGHGEFSRVVIVPGDVRESIEKVNECFYLSQEFKIPCILLGDKHLAESKQVFENHTKLIEVKNSITKPERFNSYEADSDNYKSATEDSSIIKKNVELRLKKHKLIERQIENFVTHKIYGNKNAKNLVVSCGSTKGAILDALKELESQKIQVKFLQVLYLEPFSSKITDEIKKAKKIIVIENNSTSQLSRLIAEKTQVVIPEKDKILKYDGRAFLSDELSNEIKRRLR